jgi:hypothetical protein
MHIAQRFHITEINTVVSKVLGYETKVSFATGAELFLSCHHVHAYSRAMDTNVPFLEVHQAL